MDKLCLRLCAKQALEDMLDMHVSITFMQSIFNTNHSKVESSVVDHGTLSSLSSCEVAIHCADNVINIIHPPLLIHKICSFLSKHLDVEGLFRVPGSCKRTSLLKEQLEHGHELTNEHPHDVANILSQTLRNSSVRLFPPCLNPLIEKIMQLTEETMKLSAIQLCCLLLPPCHLDTLVYLLHFFDNLVSNKNNRMTSYNVSTVLSPNILESDTVLGSVEMHRAKVMRDTEFVNILLKHSKVIGIVPPNIREIVCPSGNCVHKEEWQSMVDANSLAVKSTRSKTETRRRSLADRLFSAVCPKKSNTTTSTNKAGKESKKRQHESQDEECPAKRRSLQGVDGIKSFPFNAAAPRIQFTPAEDNTNQPQPARHDSGSTACFGTNRSNHKQEGRADTHLDARMQVGVSYPVNHDEDARHKLKPDDDKTKKGTFLKKLTNSFISPAARRRLKRRSKGQRYERVLSNDEIFSKKQLDTDATKNGSSVSTVCDFKPPTSVCCLVPVKDASSKPTPSTGVNISKDLSTHATSSINDSITIFDMSHTSMISREKTLDHVPMCAPSPIPRVSSVEREQITPGIENSGCELDLADVNRTFEVDLKPAPVQLGRSSSDVSTDHKVSNADVNLLEPVDGGLINSKKASVDREDEYYERIVNATLEENLSSTLEKNATFSTEEHGKSQVVSEANVFDEQHTNPSKKCDVVDSVNISAFVDTPVPLQSPFKSSCVNISCHGHEMPSPEESILLECTKLIDEMMKEVCRQYPHPLSDCNVTVRKKKPLPPPRSSSKGALLKSVTVVEELGNASIDHSYMKMYSDTKSCQLPDAAPKAVPLTSLPIHRLLQATASAKIKLFENRTGLQTTTHRKNKEPNIRSSVKVSAKIDHFNHLAEPATDKANKPTKLAPLPYRASIAKVKSSSFKMRKPKTSFDAKSSPRFLTSQKRHDVSSTAQKENMPPAMTSLLPHYLVEGSPFTSTVKGITKKTRSGSRKSRSLDSLVEELRDFSQESAIDDDSVEVSCSVKSRNEAFRYRCNSIRPEQKIPIRYPLVVRNLNVGRDFLDYSPIKRATPKEPRSRLPVMPIRVGSPPQ